MPKSLIMPDCCLASLAKSRGLLQDLSQLVNFFEPWHDVFKYAEAIFQCLQKKQHSNNAPNESLIEPCDKNIALLDPQISARLKVIEKKKAKGQLLTGRLSALKSAGKTPRARKSPTLPPVTIKLIRLGKRKVKVTANAVESTPPKRMRKVTAYT